MLSKFWILLFANCALGAYPTTHIAHLEPVTHFELSPISNTVSKKGQLYPDQMELKFRAKGQEYHVHMTINHDLYDENTRFVWHGENNEVIKDINPVSTTYYGEMKGGTASVTIQEDGRIQAFLATPEGLFTVEPLERYQDELKKTHLEEISALSRHKLVMYAHEDHTHHLAKTMPISVHPQMFASSSPQRNAQVDHNDTSESQFSTATMRRLLQGQWREVKIGGTIQKRTNCYPGETTPKSTYVNLLAHYSHYDQWGKSEAKQMANLEEVFAVMNAMYKQQISFGFVLGDVTFMTAAGTHTWNNLQSCQDSTYAVEQVEIYTEKQTNRPGVWHWIGKCYPGEGIANTGTVCKPFNSGVSDMSLYWIVIGHEIGHILGAGHSFEKGQGQTGGIMDYVDEGRYPVGATPQDGVVMFNPTTKRMDEICARVAATQGVNNNFKSKKCWFVADGSSVTPPPTNVMQCSALTLTNGNITYTNSRNPGSVATYTCNNNYALSGTAKRTCQQTGLWSGTPAKCIQTTQKPTNRPTPKITPKPTVAGGTLNPTSKPTPAFPTPAPGDAPKLVDAAFSYVIPGEARRFYVIKNNYFTMFESLDMLLKGTAAQGFPKLLSVGLPGLSFDTIDAVVPHSANEDNADFYFFKGKQYVKYRMYVGQHNGYPLPITEINRTWSTGSIEAGMNKLPFGSEVLLFRNGQIFDFDFSDKFDAKPRTQTVQDVFGVASVDAAIATGTGRTLVFKDDAVATYSNTLSQMTDSFTAAKISDSSVASDTCSVTDCDVCAPDAVSCSICGKGFHALYTFCHSDFTVSHLDFDGKDSVYFKFVDKTAPMTPTVFSEDGVLKQAQKFNGNEMFTMKGFDFFWKFFAMEMYIKPDVVTGNITLVHSVINQATNKVFRLLIEDGYIVCVMHGITVKSINAVTAGNWHYIKALYSDGLLRVIVDGAVAEKNFKASSDSILFKNWNLGGRPDTGAHTNFKGLMDQFELSGSSSGQSTNGQTSSSSALCSGSLVSFGLAAAWLLLC